MTPDRLPPSTELPLPSDGPATPDPSAAGVAASSAASSAPAAAAASSASASSAAELTALVRAEIEGSPDRRITFARYMELALYTPRLGYYRRTADRPTDAGDFLTAPETHPIFGWTVARRIEAMWEELGRPRPFAIVEFGAGSGTLALAVLNGLRRHGATELLDAIEYEPVESNPNRLADLRDRFAKAGLAGLLAPVTETSNRSVPVTGVILANEFLDALPVHRVVVQDGELRELYVTWLGGRFAEVTAEPPTPELAARLAADGVALADGQVAEICLEIDPWLRGVASHLARGFIIAIDYGYEAAELYGPRHLAGTLLGYRGHRVEVDPFAAPGETDLTAHVDFTAVARNAAGLGFRTVSLTTQSELLVTAGLEEELRALQASPDLTLADYTRARSGIIRMLDPRHMGGFRVLTLERV
jgi:SAM-dependent MidA family methyltransferase